jgi:hypothetical protein
VFVGDRILAQAPFDRRKIGRLKAKSQLIARVNHLLTIPW